MRYEQMGGLDCMRLTNDVVELLVSVSAGPRIMRYGFMNGANILGIAPAASDATNRTWQPYGGHRLWAAPESRAISHAPDNTFVRFVPSSPRQATFVASVDAAGLIKEMQISIDAAGSGVAIAHRLTNAGDAPLEVAPWALTIMDAGGIAVVPQEPYRSHAEDLLPTRPLVLWSYTDLGDPRMMFTRKYIQIRCGRRERRSTLR